MANASPKTMAINNLLPNSGFSDVTEANDGAQFAIAQPALTADAMIEIAAPIDAIALGSMTILILKTFI